MVGRSYIRHDVGVHERRSRYVMRVRAIIKSNHLILEDQRKLSLLNTSVNGRIQR